MFLNLVSEAKSIQDFDAVGPDRDSGTDRTHFLDALVWAFAGVRLEQLQIELNTLTNDSLVTLLLHGDSCAKATNAATDDKHLHCVLEESAVGIKELRSKELKRSLVLGCCRECKLCVDLSL